MTSQADWPSYNGQTERQPLQPAHADHDRQRRAAGAEVDLQPAQHVAPAGDAGRRRRRDVRHERQRVLRARRRQRAARSGTTSGRARRAWSATPPAASTAASAVAGDRVFMVTDHAHLIALNRITGALLWETEMADWRQNYNATGAPLAGRQSRRHRHVGRRRRRARIRRRVRSGDRQGSVALLDGAAARASRDRRPGRAKASSIRAATTWLTGTYDPELDTVYWPTGNPGPDLIGDDRCGDNLYTDSIVALDAKTGALKWHFQFTPHDVWDYDAQETPALVDATWQGQPRKLLVQANRNGFFYVLDRTNGTFLFGQAVREERDVGDRPRRRRAGRSSCPTWSRRSKASASARRSTARRTGTRRRSTRRPACTTCRPTTSAASSRRRRWSGRPARASWAARSGRRRRAGAASPARDRHPDRQRPSGSCRRPGAVNSWGGVLSTAGGVVIFGEDSGALMAADAVDRQSRCGASRRASSGRRRR